MTLLYAVVTFIIRLTRVPVAIRIINCWFHVHDEL